MHLICLSTPKHILRTAQIVLCLAVPLWASAAHAAKPPQRQSAETIVIHNDRGGSVRKRVQEIQDIAATGQKVEIRGRHCMSSCTMFLALPNSCVDHRTTFYFHGPYTYGTTLSQDAFDAWSQVIASHYPAAIKGWYMKTGRFKKYGAIKVSGKEIIRLGGRAC